VTRMALKGNATTTGGVILEGDEASLDNGRAIARHMDLASCGRCGKFGPIFGTAHTFGLGNTHGVLDHDVVMCGCPPGTNRVIANSTMDYVA
jgi:hypothetical protein